MKTPPFVPRVKPSGSGFVVAIDGPAASGKSSTAQWVARRLNFHHVDSGALYRAATATALRKAFSGESEQWSEEKVLEAALGVTLCSTGAGQSLVPVEQGVPLGEEIRGAAVTKHVSRVAQMPAVRDWVNTQVRRAAQGNSVVVDGRDIGTVVFPDADVKIFLVADAWERARRRLTQRRGRAPGDQEIAEETERLIQRDAKDANQTVQPKDALLIDTTYLTQQEQVERIVAIVQVVSGHADTTGNS